MRGFLLCAIFCACTYGGYRFSAPYHQRPILLQQIVDEVSMVEGRLLQYKEPLSDALIAVGNLGDSEIKTLFKRTGMVMKEDARIIPKQAFLTAFEGFYKKAYLHQEDMEKLIRLFDAFSQGEKVRQACVNRVLHELSTTIEKAKEEQARYTKLYRTMGVLLGSACVVLLV